MTLLFSASAAREFTGISKNVPDKKIEPFMEGVQFTLEKILGDEGYELLITAFEADPTLAGEPVLKALLDDYIKGYVSWRVIELAGTRMSVEPDRNGTFKYSENGYNSVDGKTLAMTKADSRDMAEIYKARLEKHLEDHREDLYPWYPETTCGKNAVPNYEGGVITEPTVQQPRSYYDLEGGY